MIAPIRKSLVPRLPAILSAICQRRGLAASGPLKYRPELEMSKKIDEQEEEKLPIASSYDAPAPGGVIRHDKLFLNKTKERVYTRTWNENESFVKYTYSYVGDVLPPEVEKRDRRRKRSEPSIRAQVLGQEYDLGLMRTVPIPKLRLPCERVKVPGCRPAKLVRCAPVKLYSCYEKRCTKYPSYSECSQPRPGVDVPRECKCIKAPASCKVYAMFREYSKK